MASPRQSPVAKNQYCNTIGPFIYSRIPLIFRSSAYAGWNIDFIPSNIYVYIINCTATLQLDWLQCIFVKSTLTQKFGYTAIYWCMQLVANFESFAILQSVACSWTRPISRRDWPTYIKSRYLSRYGYNGIRVTRQAQYTDALSAVSLCMVINYWSHASRDGVGRWCSRLASRLHHIQFKLTDDRTLALINL